MRTVAFFDMFNFPLTSFELHKFLFQPVPNPSFFELERILASGVAGLETVRGFYFLSGREQLIAARLDKYNFAGRKMKRAAAVAKIFSFLPWVALVAAVNLIGARNTPDAGDIDLFIAVKPGRLWTTRFLTASLMHLFRLRPAAGNSRDKICLSFYAAEDWLDLRRLMLYESKERVDAYFVFWLANLWPLYDAGGVYEKFAAQNKYLYGYLPNWRPASLLETKKNNPGPVRKNRGSFIFDYLEKSLKKLQLALLPPPLKAIMNADSRVVINDQILKFHANDRREMYNEKWRGIL